MVGEDEADVNTGKINWVPQLANERIGRHVGDICRRRNGHQYILVEISAIS